MTYAWEKAKEIRNVDDLKKEMTAGEAFLFINTMDEHTIVIMEFPGDLVDMQGGRAADAIDGGMDGSRRN